MDVVANWFLQGSALAAAATLLLRVLPRFSATARYRVWWMTLAAVLALPLLHWLTAQPITPPIDPASAVSSYNVELAALPPWAVVIALGGYALWTGWWLNRIVGGLLHLRAAKRRCRDLSRARQGRLPRWSAMRDHGRRARLVVSDDVRSASVLGLTSPAIAVSPRLLRALEDDELDCILVHEWAHVQRRDDLARLLQVAIRAVAGLHPGVWWIDRQLHVDRETACDDWAINLTGSAKRYAACLTRLAALNLTSRDAVLMPAALSPTDLTTRVKRLLDRRRSTSTDRPLAATALCLPLLVALAILVSGIQPVVPAVPRAVLAASRSGVAALPSLMTPVARDPELALAPIVRGPVPRRQPPEPATEPQAATKSRDVVTSTTREGAATTSPVSVGTTDFTEAPAPLPAVQTPAAVAAQTVDEAPVTVILAVAEPAGEPSAPAMVPAALEEKPTTPWAVAADAGVGIGRGSQEAAVATAGFFSRFGRSIAGSF